MENTHNEDVFSVWPEEWRKNSCNVCRKYIYQNGYFCFIL